jgi:hypothetical protein
MAQEMLMKSMASNCGRQRSRMAVRRGSKHFAVALRVHASAVSGCLLGLIVHIPAPVAHKGILIAKRHARGVCGDPKTRAGGIAPVLS